MDLISRVFRESPARAGVMMWAFRLEDNGKVMGGAFGGDASDLSTAWF